MKTNYRDKSSGKLTESDIDRIAKKVLQSEQAIPEIGQAKDFFAGLKGIYSGRGYLPSKFSSALERVGKSFFKRLGRTRKPNFLLIQCSGKNPKVFYVTGKKR